MSCVPFYDLPKLAMTIQCGWSKTLQLMNQKQHNLIRNHLDYLSVKKTGPVETDTHWICLETQRLQRNTTKKTLCPPCLCVFSYPLSKACHFVTPDILFLLGAMPRKWHFFGFSMKSTHKPLTYDQSVVR